MAWPRLARHPCALLPLAAASAAPWLAQTDCEPPTAPTEAFSADEALTNWSGTHQASPRRFYEPTSQPALEALVSDAHARGQALRPLGQALSPNGLGLSSDGTLSLAGLDRILAVDTEARTVTVEAGVRVAEVLRALDAQGLTLANFSSIQEQQIGGWTQVAAHGTGAGLPTVEEQIRRMKLVTPAKGVLDLSAAEQPELFHWAKAGLGTLGVVSEVTLQCVPKHKLLEHSFVTTAEDVRQHHAERLRRFRHVRYMWIPYTDKVVVVVSSPYDGDGRPEHLPPHVREAMQHAASEKEKVTACLLSAEIVGIALPPELAAPEAANLLGFTSLRDQLLDIAPLDPVHVAKVAQVEALYWTLSAGWRCEDSIDILGFDCGGEQWVLEVAFPVAEDRPGRIGDLDFIGEVMQAIRDAKIPAPAPIEQRWTASSSAPLSPAYHGDASENDAPVHSWVGVIMYLTPGQDAEGREAIRKRFQEYLEALAPVHKKYGAVPHWAKLESGWGWAGTLDEQRRQLRQRYDVQELNRIRSELDPKRILANDWVKALLD